MSSARVTVKTKGGEGKLIVLDPNMSFAAFKAVAGEKTGVGVVKITTEGGAEVSGMDVIRDGDVLVVHSASRSAIKGKVGPATVKIAVLGSGSVGKSALTIQYVQGRFVAEYDPTIEDAHRKQDVIDSHPCFLDILDTAGQEDYVALRAQWMTGRDGFVLMYSVIDRQTFEDIRNFHDQLEQVYDRLPPVVMVGNKCDLNDERQVSKEEGSQLAKELGFLFLETSAKTGANVQETFFTVVREARKRFAPPKKSVCAIL